MKLETRLILCAVFYLIAAAFTSNYALYLEPRPVGHTYYQMAVNEEAWLRSRVSGIGWPIWWIFHLTSLPFKP